jgi:hypothetical protein
MPTQDEVFTAYLSRGEEASKEILLSARDTDGLSVLMLAAKSGMQNYSCEVITLSPQDTSLHLSRDG